MRSLVVLSFLLFGLSAGAEVKRNFIVFEVSSPHGLEQSSYSWNDQTLRYVTNSNFTQSSSDRAILGIFERPLDEALRAKLETIVAAAKKNRVKSVSFQHSIKIRVNGIGVPAGSPEYGELMELTRRLSRETWKSEDGLEVRMDEKGRPAWKALSPKLAHGPVKLNCKDIPSGKNCRVVPYGYVTLDTKEGR